MAAYILVELRRQVRADAGRRCGYCLSLEALLTMPLEIEHLIPEAAGGLTIRANLWLACHRCNKFKGDRMQAIDPLTEEIVPLFNPRLQSWWTHFDWSSDGSMIMGLTPIGRATVIALQMNNEYAVETHHFWVIAGWHPPSE